MQQIERFKAELQNTDAILVGAGSGLSSSAGFLYTGERFYQNFQDFANKYHFTDMYSAGFYPYPTPEEFWAFWSRYIWINRYTDIPRPVYQQLLSLIKDKDYFILTTNVDHCFQKAGFDKHRLFYTQGDYGLFQCSLPCHSQTYDNRQTVLQMVKQQKDMRIPTELIPYCPICGRQMSMNLRTDRSFVEDTGWHAAAMRYSDFLHRHQKQKMLFLDLGTGMNTPGIIKFPFWKMAINWPHAVYACINREESFLPDILSGKAICIQDDIGHVFDQII